MSESFVLAALERVPDLDWRAHMREVADFVRRLRETCWPNLDVAFELEREAFVRWYCGDPSSVVWLAWARTRRLADEFDAIAVQFAEIVDALGDVAPLGYDDRSRP